MGAEPVADMTLWGLVPWYGWALLGVLAAIYLFAVYVHWRLLQENLRRMRNWPPLHPRRGQRP